MSVGLYAAKAWYTRRLGVFIGMATRRGVSPDWFTAGGIVAGIGAGAALASSGLWPGSPWVAGVLIAARLGFANLDGAVARARGVSRPFGFILNEIGDRAGDAAIMLGLVVLCSRVSMGLTLAMAAAAVLASMTTTVSISAAAVGQPRANGGPLGKTERCALAAVCGLTMAYAPAGAVAPVLWGVAVLLIVGGLVTSGLRANGARLVLNAQAGTTDEGRMV
jgi:CDP-diacylglycerol--glycerol-3-phosphate 3-phosphatidyltransferase